MKINHSKYIVTFLFLAFVLSGYSQTDKMHSGLSLFADRGFCISGDTLWFKVVHKNGKDEKSNIVHVQLTNATGKLISAAVKKSVGGWAEGYIYVPDSLSSGVYFLSAFFNWQRNAVNHDIQKRSLFVYNRFQKIISEFSVPAQTGIRKNEYNQSGIAIKPGKSLFKPREKVTADIDLESMKSAGIKQVVVKAALLDELAAETGGNFYSSSAVSNSGAPPFEESDGILISGKVVSPGSGSGGKDVVVLFSLLNDPQYFDYSITDSNGLFHFFLKNASGVGEIVLQAVSESGEDWEVSLETVKMETTEPVTLENRLLTTGQMKFVEEIVDAAFYSRLFGESYAPRFSEFKMTPRFKMPFYGNPYDRVVLSEFIELSDFQEISRELLHGVQYRERGNDVTLRMLNLEAKEFFKNQPFRLINGIPIFKNSLLAPMGSDEIDYIDYVLEDRVFGDLRFSGVLAVYLKDRSNGWMARQSNLFRFNVPLLQPDTAPSYMKVRPADENIPDLRRVFYWQLHETDNPLQVEFLLSDVKGKVQLSVEGVTAEGKIFNASEIIEVK